MISAQNQKIAAIGLGYPSLPLAVALSRRFPVTGFDIDIRPTTSAPGFEAGGLRRKAAGQQRVSAR